MKIKYKIISIILAVLISLSIFLIWQNNDIVISNYNYYNNKIPKAFNNFKITHISDLHNKLFGKNQNRLINKVKQTNPDIIVITGDLIDSRRYNLSIAIQFIKRAVKICPVYYISGNHEARQNRYSDIKQVLIDNGVNVLDNEKTILNKNDISIDIIGLSEAKVSDGSTSVKTIKSKYNNYLQEMSDNTRFQILLSHRPEFFDIYQKNNIDLTFSGHVHGGQIVIPFVGGLFAPSQGFLPKYTNGLYKEKNSTLIVSRGLGNSLFPFRIFNRPHIISVTLKAKKG